MNVVFMGTPEFACPALAALAGSQNTLVAVVTGPDAIAGRGHRLTACQTKVTALRLKLPIFQPQSLRDESFIQAMAELKADVFVVIAFRILPERLFMLPRHGSINIHASLLPKYRGAAPLRHALLDGQTETGLTSFFLTRQVDEGSIISQVSIPIGPEENYTSLSHRLAELSGPFLLETLELIARPGFTPSRQDPALATPAPKIKPEDGAIDWRQARRKIHNRIRAFSEHPGAYTVFREQKLKILDSRLGDFSSVPPLAPGQLHVRGQELFVGAGDGPLGIMTLLPQGKRTMDARSFVNGYRIGGKQTFDMTERR